MKHNLLSQKIQYVILDHLMNAGERPENIQKGGGPIC